MSEKNKTLITSALNQLFGERDIRAVDRYFADSYQQHSPEVPNGAEGLRSLVQYAIIPNPDFSAEHLGMVADGDLVAVHSRYTGFGPTAKVAFDVFRLHEDRIVEHWDCMEDESAPEAGRRKSTDGSANLLDLAKTEENRKTIRSFLEHVLIKGEVESLPRFLAAEGIDPRSPSGAQASAPGNTAALLRLVNERGTSFQYDKLHRTIAEGNFVLTQSEGTRNGLRHVFYDLFRLREGRIDDYWGVAQEVPTTTASGLAML